MGGSRLRARYSYRRCKTVALPQPCRSSYASSSMSGSEYARPPTLFVTNSTISKTALFNQGAIISAQSTK